MRQTLQQARIKANKTQKEIATAIGISERYYNYIEAGTREGKCHRVWDKLEAFFEFKYSQRQLREDKASRPCQDGQQEKNTKGILP